MLWSKILHHQLIYSFVAFLFFSFLFSAGLSQNSYALSDTCSVTKVNSDFTSSQRSIEVSTSQCSNFTSSDSLFVRIDSIIIDSDMSNLVNMPNLFLSGTNSYGYFQYGYFWSFSSFSGSSSSIVSNVIFTTFYPYYRFYFDSTQYLKNYVNSITISFSFTDDLSTWVVCPEPEEPDCPDPETPYGDKLDDIKKAIYVCGAILIMLYFFFCIYKIIVKDGGSR